MYWKNVNVNELVDVSILTPSDAVNDRSNVAAIAPGVIVNTAPVLLIVTSSREPEVTA
jgi:hypothetical protein